MGSHLRKIRRRAAGKRLPAIGNESGWREDLLSLLHLAHCLGFPPHAVSAQAWSAKTKPGHFTPGVVVRANGVEHAFTLADVPGSDRAAAEAWQKFYAGVDPVSIPDIFRESRIADPLLAQSFCDGLEAAGITIPAKQRAEGTHLAPVGS